MAYRKLFPASALVQALLANKMKAGLREPGWLRIDLLRLSIFLPNYSGFLELNFGS
jgi:hypothetical protein